MQENKATGNTGKRKNQDQLICSDQNIVLFKKIAFHCWTVLMVTKILLGYLYPVN